MFIVKNYNLLKSECQMSYEDSKQKLQSKEIKFQTTEYITMQNFNSIKRVIAEIQACDSSA